MYLLLSRIPNGLDPLRERFEQHVKKAGLDSVERAVGAAAAAPAEGDAKGAAAAAAAEKRESAVEPKAYVDSLLAVHKKNSELVGKAFRGDQGFVASLDRVRRPVFLPLDESGIVSRVRSSRGELQSDARLDCRLAASTSTATRRARRRTSRPSSSPSTRTRSCARATRRPRMPTSSRPCPTR